MKQYALKAYGGMDAGIQGFLASALVEGERSASHYCRFTSG
jgi:hypothetical protein